MSAFVMEMGCVSIPAHDHIKVWPTGHCTPLLDVARES